eukprot:9499276-Pyramimonas_sp.AAC.1
MEGTCAIEGVLFNACGLRLNAVVIWSILLYRCRHLPVDGKFDVRSCVLLYPIVVLGLLNHNLCPLEKE